MSNKKRIQKRILEIELMRFRKFFDSMKNFVSFYEEWKERQKSLKLVSGAVEPKGLITENGKEKILDIAGDFRFNVDENVRAIMDNSLINTANSLRDMGKAIEKGNNNFLENIKNIKIEIPKQRVGFLGLEKQKDGSVKTVFAGSEDYK
jgi:hypothetical protein